MKIERLFNVLVLGGASVGLAHCGTPMAAIDASDSVEGDALAADESVRDAPGDVPVAMDASADTSSDVATISDAAVDRVPTNDGRLPDGALACSAMPDPGDPCGCPCCWVATNADGGRCLNTDSVCCAGFCMATGCCP